MTTATSKRKFHITTTAALLLLLSLALGEQSHVGAQGFGADSASAAAGGSGGGLFGRFGGLGAGSASVAAGGAGGGGYGYPQFGMSPAGAGAGSASASAAGGGFGGSPFGGVGGGLGGAASSSAAAAGGAGGTGGFGGGFGGAAAAGSAAAAAGGAGGIEAGLGGAGGAAASSAAAAGGADGLGGGLGGAAGAAASSAAGGAGVGVGVGAGLPMGPVPAAGLLAAGAARRAAIGENILMRSALPAAAINNAAAEAAIAGNDMAVHEANNAISASEATNAYRQAKLASARDKVNVAGTIQNAARISDAAIATHDTSTKAEDSLLGSEIAVDSAGTVLDSDAAYIPPVTSSLLRSLPYGRVSLRNIIPRPLNLPGNQLPDVWLNGQPVNYMGAPTLGLSQIMGPGYGRGFGFGLEANGASFGALGSLGGGLGQSLTGRAQPFFATNGATVNSLNVDPVTAFVLNPMTGLFGVSDIRPILANGQLEAQNELGQSRRIQSEQLLGPGAQATYQGYGRINTVPMLTGTVSDANLASTTTQGTLYPVGSALVIEPRDAFFQDYPESSSSRRNFDDRTQT